MTRETPAIVPLGSSLSKAPAAQFPYEPVSRLNRSGSPEVLLPITYPGGDRGWIAANDRLARTVLTDPRFSARSELKRVPVTRPGAAPFIGQRAYPGFFIDMDPPEHTKIRRLLAQHFTQRRVNSFRPRVEQIVAGNLTAMEQLGQPVDLVNAFAKPTAVRVLCEWVGIPYEEYDAMRSHRETIFSLEATADDGVQSMNSLTGFVAEVVSRKTAEPGGDVLSGLISSGELTSEEVAGAGVLLMTAGHDTVASMLAVGALALLIDHDQLGTLDWSAASVNTMTEELLRYLSIFDLGVPRAALEDVVLAGCLIRAGECVTVAIPSANRDSSRYRDPDTLKLARAEGGHIAFGYGPHQCIGQTLARLEMRVAYPALFHKFPKLRLAGTPENIQVTQDGAIYAVKELNVSW